MCIRYSKAQNLLWFVSTGSRESKEFITLVNLGLSKNGLRGEARWKKSNLELFVCVTIEGDGETREDGYNGFDILNLIRNQGVEIAANTLVRKVINDLD